MEEKRTIMLKNVRLSFPVLFEAESFEEGGKKEFSASFLMAKDHPSVAEVKALIVKVATAKWGEKAAAMLQALFRDDRICMHDGERKDYDGYAGNYFIRANNNVRPLIIDGARNPLTEADGKLYSGCYVNASISLWSQDNKWGKRINANLLGVQFLRDGEAFSGGSSVSVNEFDAVDAASATLENADMFA